MSPSNFDTKKNIYQKSSNLTLPTNNNYKHSIIKNRSSQSYSHTIPVRSSNHPLSLSISTSHTKKIQELYASSTISASEPITSFSGEPVLPVLHESFYTLLSYGSPINDSIICTFLSSLHSSCPETHFLDTNFHRKLKQLGWPHAYHHFFLHHQSSKYSKKTQQKPTIDSPTILIPIYANGSHWIALVRTVFNNQTFFLYSDDLNSSNTADHIRSQYLATHTDLVFHPNNMTWINCHFFTFLPHSNKCGPRTILAFTVMSQHPHPTENILLPFMDNNIAQLSCWWIAKSIICQSMDFDPIKVISH